MSKRLNRRSVLKKGAVTTLAGAGILGASGTAAANNDYMLTIENTGNMLDKVEFYVERGDCSSTSIGHREGEIVYFEVDDDGVQFDGQLDSGEKAVYEVECYEFPSNNTSGDNIEISIDW